MEIYDSASTRSPAISEVTELFKYRHLVKQIVRRDLVSRYKRSYLGVAWSLLKPLGMMVVMVVVFSTLFGRTEGYPVYILSGLIAWSLFSESTSHMIQSLVWGSSLLSRIYFPRSVFSIAALSTALINLSFSLIPLFLVMIVIKVKITLALTFLPIAILIMLMFILGFGMLISVASVFFPDIAEMYAVILRAWMYLTPIIYPESILPDMVLKLIKIFNPMYGMLNLFRAPIYEGRFPTPEELILPLGYSLFFLIVGWLLFTYKSDEMAYRV